MGVTDVGILAEIFVASSSRRYEDFAKVLMRSGFTPVFEYVGPHNRVVLDYEEDMIFLCARSNLSGSYVYFDDLEQYGIPVVSKSKFRPDDVKERDDTEGIVLHYANGHMLKVKSSWYVKAHKALEVLGNERRLWQAIVDETLDDILPTFLPEDQQKINEKVSDFWETVRNISEDLDIAYAFARKTFPTKKDYAIYSSRNPTLPFFMGWIFALWDGKVESSTEAVLRTIKQNLSTNAKFEKLKEDLYIDET